MARPRGSGPAVERAPGWSLSPWTGLYSAEALQGQAFERAAVQDVRVDHRRRHVLVAEERLDRADVLASSSKGPSPRKCAPQLRRTVALHSRHDARLNLGTARSYRTIRSRARKLPLAGGRSPDSELACRYSSRSSSRAIASTQSQPSSITTFQSLELTSTHTPIPYSSYHLSQLL